MITPRILFTDAAAAAPWVGLANKLGRQTFAAGIVKKVYQVADGVTITVKNVLAKGTGFGKGVSQDFGGICKVWIEAAAPVGGYQFYTTSPTPSWAVWKDPDHDFFPGGSSINTPTPVLFLNKDGTIDYEKTVVKPYAYASTVETIVGNNQLKYVGPTPGYLVGEGGLNRLMLLEVLPIKISWQINGISECVYYDSVRVVSDKPIPLNRPTIKVKHALFNAWVQPDGQVYGFGAFFPVYSRHIVDYMYDVFPATITKKLKGKAPDTDWPGRACTQVVGGKRFVVMYDSKGDWYCWPADAPLDISYYTEQYVTYADQAYKANIVPSSAKKCEVKYPGWVHKGISHREKFKEDPGVEILEPRYSFSFNSKGTKAIGVMVERKGSKCTYYSTDYTRNLSKDPELPITPLYYPMEVEIDSVLLDRSGVYGNVSDPQPLQEDRRGLVELSIEIAITDEGFDFSVGFIAERSPDSLMNIGALVNTAYARNLEWGLMPDARYLTEDVFHVETDDILSVFVELFRHEEQKWVVDGFDGEPSLNVPSKTKATFYKGSSFDTKLFVIPLSQSHGKGYTYSPLDPDHVLPEPPHDFVWNPNQTLSSLYPLNTRPDCSKSLYYYSAKLEHLELGSMSFYYTVRVVQQTIADSPFYEDITYKRYNIETQSKTKCYVCVMGSIINERSVGHSAIPDSWIDGWVRFSGKQALDAGEEKTPVDLIGNFRAVGHFTTQSITGYPMPPGQVKWRSQLSWVNSGYYDFISRDIHNLGRFPWWLLGICGHLTHLAISLGIMESWYGNSKRYGSIVITYSTPSVGLLSMEKTDMGGLLSFIWDLQSSFVGTLTNDINHETTIYLGTDLYTENPFPIACEGMTKDLFCEQNQGYLWILIREIQENIAPPNPDEPIGEDICRMAPMWVSLFNSAVLSRGGGAIFQNQGNVLFPGEDYINLFEKSLKIKNIELGTLYYNKAIYNHFSVTSIASKSKIIVTPSGHISYSRKDIFDLKKPYSSQYVIYSTMDIQYSNGGFIPSSLVLINVPDQTYSPDDIDWKLLDGVSWFYGKFKTDHISLYNFAYRDNPNKEPKEKGVYHLTPYEGKYGSDDFKPDFRFTTIGDVWWIYPGYEENGKPITVHEFSLAKESGMNFISEITHPRHDPRPKTTEIRLSPLFYGA